MFPSCSTYFVKRGVGSHRRFKPTHAWHHLHSLSVLFVVWKVASDYLICFLVSLLYTIGIRVSISISSTYFLAGLDTSFLVSNSTLTLCRTAWPTVLDITKDKQDFFCSSSFSPDLTFTYIQYLPTPYHKCHTISSI